MKKDEYIRKATGYIDKFCSVKPNRRTGSRGNNLATNFFARTVGQWDYKVDTTPFPCLDYKSGMCSLVSDDKKYGVFISPYSMSCKVTATLVTVSTVAELEDIDCTGKILLMKDEICAEQLMPKNFVFYNPESHKHIYTLLESKKPVAIITATTRKPELVGALYPFPMIEDGDFDIPNIYCTDIVGYKIAQKSGQIFKLLAEGKRIPSTASNVIARKNPAARKKVVICGHIDAYGSSPGALDNASGTAVLLLLAEMLKDQHVENGIEIVAFNGEDNYSAAGQMDYLRRFGDDLGRVILAVNIDDVAYIHGKSAFSIYGCSVNLQKKAGDVFGKYVNLTRGEEWYQGDHMIFVQNGIPTIAFTADKVTELMANITHTAEDTPDKVNSSKLVELAEALQDLLVEL